MKSAGTILNADRRLALVVLVLAALAALFWLPADIETGLIEKVRRRVRIGDALLPAVALVFVALGAVLTAFRTDSDAPSLTRRDLAFAGFVIGWLALCFAAMRYTGPWLADLLSDTPYRALRDTFGWKHAGYILGSTLLVAGLIAMASRRSIGHALVIGLLASLVIAALYDLPFEDLLLPPNGDV